MKSLSDIQAGGFAGNVSAFAGGGSDVLDVRDYGALGNGVADDRAAIQAAIDAGLALGSATIYFPAGTYAVSAATEIVHGKGINLIGDGPDDTKIVAGAYAAVKTRGFWRSRVEGLQFVCNGNTTGGAFELDGEPDGSFGTQGNIFSNCYFEGSGTSKYCFTICRMAGNSGQGSENLWLGCHFHGARKTNGDALVLVNGYNALQNTFLVCNFQDYLTGVKIVAGCANIRDCGFQSTIGYQQIALGGYDVEASASDSGDVLVMEGCRTESLRILNGGGPRADVSKWSHIPSGIAAWGAGAKALDHLVGGITAGGNYKLYRVTTAGTTAGAAPAWPESGTVTDGSVVWSYVDFNVFDNFKGKLDHGNVAMGKMHTVQGNGYRAIFRNIRVTQDDPFAGWNGGDASAPIIENVRVIYGDHNRAIKLGYNNNSGARNLNENFTNIGDGAIVSTTSLSGNVVYDISFQRGGGDKDFKVPNWWEFFGGLGLAHVTFAELRTITRSGVMYYVTDGTPGSSPVTGGGTGCLAVWQNGAWRALAMGAGGAGISDGDYGDVTVSAGGTAMTIDAGAVTLAKQADIASARLIGRTTAGTGVPEALTAAQVTAMLGAFTSAAQGMAPASGGGTANFLRADGTWASPGGGGSPGGTSGELQYNNAGAFAGAANVEVDSGNLKLLATADPAAPGAGVVAYAETVAGRDVLSVRNATDAPAALQASLGEKSVVMILPSTSSGAPDVTGTTLTTTGTITNARTFGSGNPWLARPRKVFTSAATAAAYAACRHNTFVQWARGGAAGDPGFRLEMEFGQSLNVNGAQTFFGLNVAGFQASTAGGTSALLNMIGMGYDTTDASTGNWQFYRNDGSGTATKVDLGASAPRNTADGYRMILYCPPGNAAAIHVRIVNLTSNTVVLDTSYTTDLPAVNVGMGFSACGNTGAVATAMNIELGRVFVESEF